MWPRKFRSDGEPIEAQKALESSQHDLYHIKARERQVENVVVDMVEIKKRNHFAEHLSLIMFKPRGGAT